MRALIALFLGLIIGAAVVWFYLTPRRTTRVQTAQAKVASAAKSARDTIQDSCTC